jgi:beta-1,4-mannosyltransferase
MRVLFLPYFPANPYQRLLMDGLSEHGVTVAGARDIWFLPRILSSRPDVLHVHWLHPFFIGKTRLRSMVLLCLFLAQWFVVRLMRLKVVWTVHNLRDHEKRWPAAERLVTRLVAGAAQRIIVHCPSARDGLKAIFPEISIDKCVVIPHGSYIGVYPAAVESSRAREALHLNASQTVFLSIGEIRPYKGIEEMLALFEQQRLPKDTMLLVAGRVHDATLRARLEQAAERIPQVDVRLGFIPDDEIPLYLSAADVVVSPFRDVLTSGSILLALSYGKTVVAPRIGCLADLAKDTRGFFYDADEPEGLFNALVKARSDPDERLAMGQHNLAFAQTLDWAKIGESTANAYRA